MKKGLYYFANILLLIFLSVHSFAQGDKPLNIEKVRRHTENRIVDAKQLGNGTTVKPKVYAIKFADKTVQLYDSDNDTLGKMVFTDFNYEYQSYVALSKGFWQIAWDLEVKPGYNWHPKMRLPESQFDSVDILYFSHFIGYKDNSTQLFCIKKKSSFFKEILDEDGNPVELTPEQDSIRAITANQDTLVGFNNIEYAAGSVPHYYERGLFIKLKSDDPLRNGKIAYIDYETGYQKSTLLVDSIVNNPTPFVGYVLVMVRDQYFVYSYKEEKIIDDSFNKHYVVPLYDCPFVLADDYVALGHHDRWTKFNIQDPESVDFQIQGDLVFAHVINKAGDKYVIDLWRKKMSKE